MVKQRNRRARKPILVATNSRSSKSKNKTSKQEVTALGKALRLLGGVGGSAVGSMFGVGPAGSAVGTGLGATLSKWLGQGDYEVSSNSIVKSAKAAPQIPLMHSSNQTVVVRNREYLGQVISSTAFTVQGFFPINPGRDDTFPWLSQIARRFQEYTLKGMVFHYVPTSGSISTTQALGSVMMQTTYRSTDAPPTSKIEMLNEYWANEAVPMIPFVIQLNVIPVRIRSMFST